MEMESTRYFKILADLTHYFWDHRSSCYIFVNIDKMKVIDDLKAHISKLFNISNFAIRCQQHHLPDAEDIRILKEGDTIHLIKIDHVQKQDAVIDVDVKENLENCAKEAKKKKKKSKKLREQSSKVGEPMEFYELTPNSTSSPNSKEENPPVEEKKSTDVVEKVELFESLEHVSKKRKCEAPRLNKTYHPLCKLDKTTNIVKTIIASKSLCDEKKISNVRIDIISPKVDEPETIAKDAVDNTENNTPEGVKFPICETPSNKDKESEVFVNSVIMNISKPSLTDLSEVEAVDTTTEGSDVFIGARKRKRTRKRKNQNRKKPEGNVELESTWSETVFKPPNTQGKPSSHIKFDESEDVIMVDSSLNISEMIAVPVEAETTMNRSDIHSSSTVFLEDSHRSSQITVESPKLDSLLPKPNDKLIFKKLKIGNDYTPSISEPITAIIESYDDAEKKVQLNIIEGKSEFREPDGKFNMLEQTEDDSELKTILTWDTLIEPKLIPIVV